MPRTIAAGLLGYVVFVMLYAIGALLMWTILGEPPFKPDSGGLTTSWMMVLLLMSVVGGLVGGWVCRRVGQDQRSVAVLVAILVGLALIVVLTEMLIGPTASGLAFVERLFGPVPADMPFAELLDGRPQPWFVVTNYVVAILAIVVGAGIARKAKGS
jgi:hypothetical protein